VFVTVEIILFFAVYFFADGWGGEAHTLNMPFGLEDAVWVY